MVSVLCWHANISQLVENITIEWSLNQLQFIYSISSMFNRIFHQLKCQRLMPHWMLQRLRWFAKKVHLANGRVHWHLGPVHRVAVAHWFHQKSPVVGQVWSSVMRFVSFFFSHYFLSIFHRNSIVGKLIADVICSCVSDILFRFNFRLFHHCLNQ